MNKNYKTIIIFSIFFILAGGSFISKYLTLKNRSNIKNLANNIYDLSISMPTHNSQTEKIKKFPWLEHKVLNFFVLLHK